MTVGIIWALHVLILFFAQPVSESDRAFLERYLTHVQTHSDYAQSAKDFITRHAAEAANTRRSSRDFVPESLSVLYPQFRRGLDAFEALEFAHASKIMGKLALTSDDPYLSIHAALFQAKALIQQTQLRYAIIVLSFMLSEAPEEHTLLIDEMTFLLGYCQFHTFEMSSARQTLETFLAMPNSHPEMRVSAKQMLATISQNPKKDLTAVCMFMDEAGTLLDAGEHGLDAQLNQKKAILILEELIKQAQDQEQQQQSQRQQASSMNQQPQQPARESKGSASRGMTETLRPAPRVSPGATWGQMPAQDREKIMQVIQEGFPSRYRELIEQYYQELSDSE